MSAVGPLTTDQREHWDREGYLVLPRFFPPSTVERVDELVEREWSSRRRPENPLVIDVLDGPLAHRRMYFRDAPDDARAYPYKLNDLYLASRELRRLVLDRRLVAVLRSLLGGEPALCNSLNFERGSQQDYHFDTYYMPGPCPDGLIVASICLEDVHPDAGPLTYYPRSHRIPPYRFSHGDVRAVPAELPQAAKYARDALEERGLTAEEFAGQKGDVFIWHEQLYHGGRPINDAARTRKSVIAHYWRADVLTLPPGWKMRRVGRQRRYLARAHQPVPEDA